MSLIYLVCILFGVQIVTCSDEVPSPQIRDVPASECSQSQFRCKSGACVPGASRCNGTIECPDRSDELFVLCRNNTCAFEEFRCTYGACMPLAVRCNDKRDCADNSDELVPLCRNDYTDFNICQERIIEDRTPSRAVDCENFRTRCDDGQVLTEPTKCDGHVDCADGSDETLAKCAEAECVPPLFRCAYGGCAYPKAACDGVVDCADGSDESFELCGRTLPPTTTPKPVCTLPPQPLHGRYSMGGRLQGQPGQPFHTFMLKYTCDDQYGLVGSNTLFCINGDWSGDLPRCVRFCRIPQHESVQYRCSVTLNGKRGTEECADLVPDGTFVKPRCREPFYYYPGDMPYMYCNDTTWDKIITCTPECGKRGSPGDALLLGGRRAWGEYEVPWHVGIYHGPRHQHKCSGTLVRNNIVISAAHCFWGINGLQNVSNYKVAAGKLYRTWNHANDTNAQTSDIQEIIVPERFQGALTNYQDDIAVVRLVTSLRYTEYVRPVCIDFDADFDARQLKVLSIGKIAGWGRAEDGRRSEVLRVARAPYVSIQDCIADTPEAFKAYITSDKICAGYKNGTALCLGDSGGGLTFITREWASYRYYLRGVASIVASTAPVCRATAITSYTHVYAHQEFLQRYL